jgi:alpha-1,2-mannosyltransferase
MITGTLLDALRSGAFLTRERVRLVGFALLAAYAIGLAYLAVTAHGLSDAQGRPLGTDFSNIYAAGTYVLEGRPEAPFDPALQYAREQAIFGAATPFYGWHYPPFFLIVAAPLALLPYVPALLLWQAATLALYLLAIRAILTGPPWRGVPSPSPRLLGERGGEGAPPPARTCGEAPSPGAQERADLSPHTGRGEGSGHAQLPYAAGEGGFADSLWLLLALAFPAVFVNLGHGHNGFLTAALIGAALAALDRRPVIAGMLFGLLAYKPQFGLLVPLALVTAARYRCFAAACATVAALLVITTLAFGPPVWEAFFASLHFTRTVVLEAGETGWHKIQSVFALVRMWGGPIALAYAVQSAATLALAAAVVWLWRLKVDFALKAAVLVIAAILATPYSLDYDMTALAPAIAFLAVHGSRHGFAPYEKGALAALWFAPLIARTVAEAVGLPLGVLAMAAVLGLALNRAAATCGLIERFRLAAG